MSTQDLVLLPKNLLKKSHLMTRYHSIRHLIIIVSFHLSPVCLTSFDRLCTVLSFTTESRSEFKEGKQVEKKKAPAHGRTVEAHASVGLPSLEPRAVFSFSNIEFFLSIYFCFVFSFRWWFSTFFTRLLFLDSLSNFMVHVRMACAVVF